MPTESHARAALRFSQFTAQPELKLIAGVIFSGLFSGVFQLLQRTPFGEAVVWRECWTWSALPFSDAWTLPYLSLFPLIALAWFAQPDWRELRRFLTAMLGAALVGWVAFLLFPTASVRPPVAGTGLIYQWMVALDRPTNSCPALHSAFATVAAVGLAHGASRVGPVLRFAVWAWVALIAVATVALRQHTDFDVLAGFAVGGIAGALYRRTFAEATEPSSASDEDEMVNVRR